MLSTPLPHVEDEGGEEAAKRQVRGRAIMDISIKIRSYQKSLRSNQTDAENRLWYYLRNRNFFGYKFRRQHIIKGYIVDFVCIEKKLIIELDGSQHLETKRYDEKRTWILGQLGYLVLRFWNNEVLENTFGVLEVIKEVLQENSQ